MFIFATIFCSFWTLVSLVGLFLCYRLKMDWRAWAASATMVLCWGLEAYQSYTAHKTIKARKQ